MSQEAAALTTGAPESASKGGASRGSAEALGQVRSALPEELRDRVATARELGRRNRREDRREPYPTALDPLDRLLEGGLPRGRLVELVGRRSCGRLSTVLAALAAITRRGEAAALVDLGDGLDPRSAAAAGLDLERLLWLRPRSTKETVAAAEILLEGGFPMVALDLGNPPVPGGRGAEAAWLRLARGARERGAVLLVSSPYRVSGTAATAVLATGRRRSRWCRGDGGRLGALLTGLDAELVREKHRGSTPGARGLATFRTGPPWSREIESWRRGGEELPRRRRRSPGGDPPPLPWLTSGAGFPPEAVLETAAAG